MEENVLLSHVEVSQLMMTSSIKSMITQQISQLVQETSKQQPSQSLSDILLSCSLKLYQDAMKQLAFQTLSQISKNSMLKVSVIQQNDKNSGSSSFGFSSKLSPSRLSNQNISTLSQKSCMQSQFMILRLKYNISYEICFQLFRNYASKKNLQIIEDYGFRIIFKDKSMRRFGSILDCIKPLGDPLINLSFITSANVIRIELIQRAVYKKSHPHYQKMLYHVQEFKKQLWSYGCIQVSQNQTPTFINEIVNREISIFNKNQTSIENMVIKYSACKQKVLTKYKSNITSKISQTQQIVIQKLIQNRLNIHEQFRSFYINETKQFAQRKDDINASYSLSDILNFYSLERKNNVTDISLSQSTLNFLQSQTLAQNIQGLRQFQQQIFQVDNNHAHLLAWAIIHLLYIKSGTIYSTLKLLQIYFRHQDKNKQLEQFNLNVIFALEYIKGNMYKELELSLK